MLYDLTLISCSKAQLGQPCSKGGPPAIVMLIIMFGVIAVIGGIWEWAKKRYSIPDRPPREPRTDFPPFLYELASATKNDAYTAPVRAVTPSGISGPARPVLPERAPVASPGREAGLADG